MAFQQGQQDPPQSPPLGGRQMPTASMQQEWGPPSPPPRRKRTGLKVTLGVLGALIVLLFVAAALGSNHRTSSTPAAVPTTPTPASAAARAAAPGIGTKVRDGQFEFVVIRVAHAKSVGATQFWLGDTAQGEYLIVSLKVTNIGSQSQTLDGSAQHVYDSAGREYDASSAADIDLAGVNGRNSTWLDDINPGNTVYGKVAFDMPKADAGTKIELHDFLLSGGVTVLLK